MYIANAVRDPPRQAGNTSKVVQSRKTSHERERCPLTEAYEEYLLRVSTIMDFIQDKLFNSTDGVSDRCFVELVRVRGEMPNIEPRRTSSTSIQRHRL